MKCTTGKLQCIMMHICFKRPSQSEIYLCRSVDGSDNSDVSEFGQFGMLCGPLPLQTR